MVNFSIVQKIPQQEWIRPNLSASLKDSGRQDKKTRSNSFSAITPCSFFSQADILHPLRYLPNLVKCLIVLFYCDAFGEISWLIYIQTFRHADIISEKL